MSEKKTNFRVESRKKLMFEFKLGVVVRFYDNNERIHDTRALEI